MIDFNNKSILITGASTGIGEALTVRLSHEKCKIAILARRFDKLVEIAQKTKGSNSSILPIKCDVRVRKEVIEAHKIIISEFKKIDIAILNAGIGGRLNAAEFDSQYIEDIYSTNLFGVIYWIEQLLPGFIDRRDGIIAGVSSLADNRGYSDSGIYCSSKAALTIFLDGLRTLLTEYNIKVITVKPGFVQTPMTFKTENFLPFLISAEKAAKIIVKGISKEKSIIQFPLLTAFFSKLIGLVPTKMYNKLATNILNRRKNNSEHDFSC
ncbi:SDR family NAD(P)-dependent oxidoreductase [Bacteroidota bacterium]